MDNPIKFILECIIKDKHFDVEFLDSKMRQISTVLNEINYENTMLLESIDHLHHPLLWTGPQTYEMTEDEWRDYEAKQRRRCCCHD